MNKTTFTRLIQNPGTIGDADMLALEQVVQAFPYCHTAHMLLAKASHDKGSMMAPQRLRKAAIHAPSRSILKKLIESAPETERQMAYARVLSAQEAISPTPPPAAIHALVPEYHDEIEDLIDNDFPENNYQAEAKSAQNQANSSAEDAQILAFPAPEPENEFVAEPEKATEAETTEETPSYLDEVEPEAPLAENAAEEEAQETYISSETRLQETLTEAAASIIETQEPETSGPEETRISEPEQLSEAIPDYEEEISEETSDEDLSAAQLEETFSEPASEIKETEPELLTEPDQAKQTALTSPEETEQAVAEVEYTSESEIITEEENRQPVSETEDQTTVITEENQRKEENTAEVTEEETLQTEAAEPGNEAVTDQNPETETEELTAVTPDTEEALLAHPEELTLEQPVAELLPEEPAEAKKDHTSEQLYSDELIRSIYQKSELGYSMSSSRMGECLQRKSDITTEVPFHFQPELLVEYTQATPEEPEPELDAVAAQQEIINDFLKQASKGRNRINQAAKAEEQQDLSSKSTKLNKSLVSENLAQIFAMQGKNKKAIKIYQQLQLKIPKKKDYFAAQIVKLQNIS